ncbi:MAG: hypothetical protein J0L84_07960 [Verrucomicrobia bacterium]|nr:hypothetical protein [Verrucomicrobiota bacterium]
MPDPEIKTPLARLSGLWARLGDGLGAWQPLTGPGLARFADASFPRLILFQILLAAWFGLLLAWTYGRLVPPVVQAALPALPESEAGIHAGILHWPGPGPKLLASSPQLALVCDAGGSGELGLNGDLQVELRRDEILLRGLLGSLAVPYPPDLDLPLDQASAPAIWGAWRLPLRAALATAAMLLLPLTWWVLAALYCLPAWCWGWLWARDLPPGGALRIALAALLPASLIPGLALVAYATLWIRAPGLVLLWVLHLPAGWLWLGWGILSRPRQNRPPAGSARPPPNPFSPEERRARATSGKRGAKNPFGT